MRLYLAVITLFLSGFSLKAQQSPADPKTSSLLWEISGNGMQTPSYLFGTMHILCARDAGLSDSLNHAIDKSSRVFFEIDMDNMGEMMGIFKYIRMKDETRLKDLMTEEEYKRVKDYFAANRSILPLSMMERFKPYFIAAMLSESKMPCETKNGMEEVIMKAVKKQKKEISGLETIEFQASIFDSIPYSQQARELLQAIDSSGKEDTVTAKMLEVYRSQDLDAIEKLTKMEEGGLGSYMELFLYGRNKKWIPEMEKAMKNGTILFAVGAAHLPGNEGVINLLRKAGYTLRPMRHSVAQTL
ncbi:TraB/GumN family protein [Flavihumibacter sediminis]|nr:TraB/GumN family protein [Flavihumibacter sediminis]